MSDLIAKASVSINAPVEKVWDALVNPDTIKQYMFGTTVASDWKEGSDIKWKGEWKGKAYEDKGKLLKVVPLQTLQYSHFSPLSGQPDVPGNYHIVTIKLTKEGESISVALSQDKNATEEMKAHSEKNWKMMLDGLKKVVENTSSSDSFSKEEGAAL